MQPASKGPQRKQLRRDEPRHQSNGRTPGETYPLVPGEPVRHWRFGDGTIRLTRAEAEWLFHQPGTPGLVWAIS